MDSLARGGSESIAFRGDRLRIAARILVVAGLAGSSSAQRGAPADYPPPLDSVWVPTPTLIDEFIDDHAAAVALGKSLFWDTQLGSDGQTACASCHGHAGVDPRFENTLNPGSNGTFDGGVPAGGALFGDYFPTTGFALAESRFSPMVRNIDDVTGSQGVLRRFFEGLAGRPPIEVCEDQPDAIFNEGGVNVRQVTGRSSPSVINAVFNIRQFWDGRASHWFNGTDIAGPTHPEARVWERNPATGALQQVAVMLDFSGLASQAMGPVLNGVEMSCSGRTWEHLATRLLDARALATQQVSPTDSVLGPLVAAEGVGLAVSYRELFHAAFDPRWASEALTPQGVPQVAANFPLLIGLALQAYEATLVSDDSPYDRFAAAGFPLGGGGHLDAVALEGLDLFVNIGQFPDLPITNCALCHVGPAFSSATWPGHGVVAPPRAAGPVRAPNGIEAMLMKAAANLASATFADHPADGDPTIQPLDFPLDGDIELVLLDPGSNDPDDGEEVLDGDFPVLPNGCDWVQLGAIDADEGDGVLQIEIRAAALPKGRCGSWVRFDLVGFPIGRYALLMDDDPVATLEVVEDGRYDFGFYNIGVRPTEEDLGVGATTPDGIPLSWTRRRQQGLPLPEVDAPIAVPAEAATGVDGAFKTPGLRNVALTGPYMRHGGMSTLRQVVEFYNRGGDFHEHNIENLSPEMGTLGLHVEQIDALVAFLETLTDERVAMESAPFDHPELPLPNGSRLPMVGMAGRAAECLPPLEDFEARLAGVPLEGDCDGDGRIDACMILKDPSLDSDGNGVLDVCEKDGGGCDGDFDGDGHVNGTDLALVLAFWGSDSPLADCDGNGLVNGSDLAVVLANWTG